MPESDGTEPVAKHEILYRNIPVKAVWYDPNQDPPTNYQAFTPKRHDPTGISFWRQKYKKTAQEAAAEGRFGKEYYVAVIKAIDLMDNGVEITASPHKGGVGHASISVLNYGDGRTDRVLELARLIAAELCIRVEGPFPGQKQVD